MAEHFNILFGKLLFTLVEINKSGYDLYAAAVKGQLMGGKKRYVILSVPFELSPHKQKERIDNLRWESIQTRTLENSYPLIPQEWVIPRDFPIIVFNVKNRLDTYSEYFNEQMQVEVLILHDPKKKTIYQYNNNMELIAILETFSAIFRKRDFPYTISPQSLNSQNNCSIYGTCSINRNNYTEDPNIEYL